MTALFPLRNFTALEYASEFLVGAASIDIAVFGIEVKYTPALAAAIAAKHIIAEQHIQMSASIIAKGASALPLRLGSPHYGNAKQVNDNYDIRDLVPTAPLDVDAAVAEVRDILNSIEDSEYRQLCQTMLERHMAAFETIPAAKSVHHAFRSGLLMHTLNMLRAADSLARLYCEVIDRSLLIAGTFLHDFGKEPEMERSELGLVTNYSVPGLLLGHLYMGAREVAKLAAEQGMSEEKAMLLQHLILSHHGQPEYGAAVEPQCAESELLSIIDLMDSCMEIYAEAITELKPGAFSGKLFALGKAVYRHT